MQPKIKKAVLLAVCAAIVFSAFIEPSIAVDYADLTDRVKG